jgi:hypothetical protein
MKIERWFGVLVVGGAALAACGEEEAPPGSAENGTAGDGAGAAATGQGAAAAGGAHAGGGAGSVGGQAAPGGGAAAGGRLRAPLFGGGRSWRPLWLSVLLGDGLRER